MNIAICHFRARDTDGVSLEMNKWEKCLEQIGHKIFFLTGNLKNKDSYIIKGLNYSNKKNLKIVKNAYYKLEDYNSEEDFRKDVLNFAERIKVDCISFIRKYKIDNIIVNNIFSLGFSIPAAIGLYNAIKVTGIHCIGLHHDFYWERIKYISPTNNLIKKILEDYFPPRDKLIKHIVINKIAKNELLNKKRINSIVIPNVFDFNSPLWEKDDFNYDFKKIIGVEENDIIFLQATRVTERKAIEFAIELVSEIQKEKYREIIEKNKLYDGRRFSKNSNFVLVVAGIVEPEGDYVNILTKYAEYKKVKILFKNEIIGYKRKIFNRKKTFSLWDAYVFADIITYPSILEGWGNQFLEGIFSKKPMVVYEYPVFISDIKEKGFNIVSLGNSYNKTNNNLCKIEDNIIEDAAKKCIKLLIDREYRELFIEKNFILGKKYYSYKTLISILKRIFPR